MLIIAVLSFLVLVTPALALNVTVSVDKNKVFMGDSVTLSGKIMLDDNTTKVFEYRAAFVGPKRTIICDSNKTMTASDGTFTLKCKLPTAQEANNSGIPASLTRAVIPYKSGVAVKDPATNETVKRHARTIIAINPDKFNKHLDEIIQGIDNFVNQSQKFIPECDAIAEKATRYNVTDVTTHCLEIQQKINNLIANATAISDNAKQLKTDINATSIEDFTGVLKDLKESLKDLRDELKDIKDAIRSVRWDTLKEVRKSMTDIKQEIEKKRTEAKEMVQNKSSEKVSKEQEECRRIILDCERSTRVCSIEKYDRCKYLLGGKQ